MSSNLKLLWVLHWVPQIIFS